MVPSGPTDQGRFPFMTPDVRNEFRQWARGVPLVLRNDGVWRLAAYRIARFTSSRAWEHTTILVREPRMWVVARQLYGALGSVCANLAEGHSRRSPSDRARLYEYALGSARESREWYLHAMPILGEEETLVSIGLLDEVTALAAAYVSDQRRRAGKP